MYILYIYYKLFVKFNNHKVIQHYRIATILPTFPQYMHIYVCVYVCVCVCAIIRATPSVCIYNNYNYSYCNTYVLNNIFIYIYKYILLHISIYMIFFLFSKLLPHVYACMYLSHFSPIIYIYIYIYMCLGAGLCKYQYLMFISHIKYNRRVSEYTPTTTAARTAPTPLYAQCNDLFPPCS